MQIKIAPSILSANKNKLNEEVKKIEPYADLLHVDIMDGKFVPRTSFSVLEIKNINTKLDKDVHLMVEHPMVYVDDFYDAGASIITFHLECKDDIKATINKVKIKGIKVGLAINPETPIEALLEYSDIIDMALIMSVHPGYGGQKFIDDVLPKIKILRELKPKLDIEIDGSINVKTIKQVIRAGANIIVAGSAIFSQRDKVKAIKALRECIDKYLN